MIFVKSFAEPPFSVEEILRYANGDINDKKTKKLVKELIEESKYVFNYKVCYSILPIKINGENDDDLFQIGFNFALFGSSGDIVIKKKEMKNMSLLTM